MPQDILAKYGDIIAMAEAQTGVPANLIAAQIKQESGGNSDIFSSAGAGGLMQLMPGTAAELGVTDVTDPEQNIIGGATYMAKMLDMYDGDVSTALAAYNAGPGNVNKYGGIPPFKETQNYVSSILANLGEQPTPEKPQKKVTGSLADYLDNFEVPDQQAGADLGVPTGDGSPALPDAKNLNDYLDNIDLGDGTPTKPPVEPSTVAPDTSVAGKPAGSSAQWLPESILNALGVNAIAKKIADTDVGKTLTQKRNEFEAAGENAVVDLLEKGFNAFGVEVKRGDRVTPQKVAQRSGKVKAESKASVKANPIKSMLTQALAFQAGPGQVIGGLVPAPIEGASKLLNATKIIGGGAAQGAGYEAVTNPDATKRSIGTAGVVGGGVAGTLAGGINATKFLAEKISKGALGKYLGIDKPEVIQNLLDEPGLVSPSTAKGFSGKIQKFVNDKEDELQAVLSKSDVEVNVGDILNTALKDPKSELGKVFQQQLNATGKPNLSGFELLQTLIKNKGSTKALTAAERKVLELSKHGTVSVSKLNELKRTFWKLSKFKKSGDPAKDLEFAIGEEFKRAIEKALPKSPVAKINQQMGSGIEALKHIKAKTGDPVDKVVSSGNLFLQYLMGPAAYGKMAYSGATKTGLGATTTASAFKRIGEMAKDRPELAKFLSIIIPQAFTGKSIDKP